MQNSISDKTTQKPSEDSQAKGANYTPARSDSPTASLGLCEHCGEEYCTDAIVGTAQVARKGAPAAVVISYSTPSTPANPLRKKRKLHSLVSKAKEQADPCVANLMATKPDEFTTHTLPRKPVATDAKYERSMKLQLQIPNGEFISRDFAPPHLGNTSLAASPSSFFGFERRMPERRKLDELRAGSKRIYNNDSPTKTSSRLSFLKRG